MFSNSSNLNKKKIIFKFFDNESLKETHKRIIFIASLFLLVYFSILIKLTNVMILSNFSDNQIYSSSKNNSDLYERGNIYDRNGELLATTIRSFSLAARTALIKDKESIAEYEIKTGNLLRCEIQI